MIALNCKINENITGLGQFVLWKEFGFYDVDLYTGRKFYPKHQQNELTLILNIKNSSIITAEIEIGIEENLSVNNKITLIKTSLNPDEIKNFQVKTDIFLRTLRVDNPAGYYYALYYNATGNFEVKGLFNLSVKNKLYAPVPL